MSYLRPVLALPGSPAARGVDRPDGWVRTRANGSQHHQQRRHWRPNMTERYRCANCGGVFLIGRPDEEAQAEALRDFGRDGHAPDMVVICDPCYKQMRERAGDAWGTDDRSVR